MVVVVVVVVVVVAVVAVVVVVGGWDLAAWMVAGREVGERTDVGPVRRVWQGEDRTRGTEETWAKGGRGTRKGDRIMVCIRHGTDILSLGRYISSLVGKIMVSFIHILQQTVEMVAISVTYRRRRRSGGRFSAHLVQGREAAFFSPFFLVHRHILVATI